MISFEDLTLEEQLDWLRTASRREINEHARLFNWDGRPEVFLKEVTLREDCNLGTALTIYAMGLPSEHDQLNQNGQFDDMLAFLGDLRDRINSGHYRNDPADPLTERDRVEWHVDGGMLVKDAPKLPWAISTEVYEQTFECSAETAEAKKNTVSFLARLFGRRKD